MRRFILGALLILAALVGISGHMGSRAIDLGNRRAAFGASVLTDGLAGKTVTTE